MASESDTREFSTRHATPADLEGIYHCLGQVVTFVPEPSEWSAIGRRFFEQDAVCAFLAEHRDDVGRKQVIGYASVCFETMIRGGIIGHVDDVVVDLNYRRGGVGLMLVRALQFEARLRGAYRLYLECSDENTRFYSAAGFNRSGVSMSWHVT
jgi:GNAT superfamily N-acetyltransferase